MGLFKPDVDKMRDKKDVTGLIKALGHKDWRVRDRAENEIECYSRYG